jgi:hypothetical protein
MENRQETKALRKRRSYEAALEFAKAGRISAAMAEGCLRLSGHGPGEIKKWLNELNGELKPSWTGIA